METVGAAETLFFLLPTMKFFDFFVFLSSVDKEDYTGIDAGVCKYSF